MIMMACPLTTNDLTRIFEKLDKNRDGLVSLDELNCLLDSVAGFRLSLAELEALVGKPSLDLAQFLHFYESLSPSSNAREEDRTDPGLDRCGESSPSSSKSAGDEVSDDLVKAFKVFDLNGDGFISCDELRNVLVRLGLMEESSTGRDCKSMIGAFDSNSDGQLDFEEFKNMMLLTSS